MDQLKFIRIYIFFLRVQAHATTALLNWAERCDTKILAPYLNQLLQYLQKLLSSNRKNVQEQVFIFIFYTQKEKCFCHSVLFFNYLRHSLQLRF
jgi:hypothetical protein